VQEDIKANGGQIAKDLNVLIDEKKAQIQDEKTWVQRFFSIKTFHACVMYVPELSLSFSLFGVSLQDFVSVLQVLLSRVTFHTQILSIPLSTSLSRSITVLPSEYPHPY
jgi:hypothetical protein